MLKKKMIMLVAAALMTLSASSAFAAFGNLSLIRVVSDLTAGSTTEVATDLGTISSLIGANNLTVGGGITDAFTNFTNSTHNLQVNYYAWQTAAGTKGTLYIASNNATAPTAAGSSSVKGVLNTINPFYAALSAANGNANTVVTSNTTPGSFGQQMGMTALGGYSVFAGNFASNTSLSLAGLSTKPLEMTLWQFANGTTALGFVSPGTQVGAVPFTITTNANGSTTINNAATPIPAAAWLLGSGLMGLFGLRRKMNA